jgi:hypothetical protein
MSIQEIGISKHEKTTYFSNGFPHIIILIDPMYVDTYGTKKGQSIPGSYRKPIGFYRQWNIFYR